MDARPVCLGIHIDTAHTKLNFQFFTLNSLNFLGKVMCLLLVFLLYAGSTHASCYILRTGTVHEAQQHGSVLGPPPASGGWPKLTRFQFVYRCGGEVQERAGPGFYL